MSEWQDIETAPKWWNPVILYDPQADPSVFEGYFSGEDNDKDGRWRESGNKGLEFEPTHWQPLPKPPVPTHNPEKEE